MSTTAKTYDRAVRHFESYLAVRGHSGGAAALLADERLVAGLLRLPGDSGAGHVGDVISGLNRLCFLTGGSGGW